MPEEIKLLAKRTRTMRERLDELWNEVGDDAERQDEIYAQMKALDREIMRLISINIKARGAEYDDATAALGTANTKLVNAISDINKFVKAIEFTAKAIALVAKVKPV